MKADEGWRTEDSIVGICGQRDEDGRIISFAALASIVSRPALHVESAATLLTRDAMGGKKDSEKSTEKRLSSKSWPDCVDSAPRYPAIVDSRVLDQGRFV